MNHRSLPRALVAVIAVMVAGAMARGASPELANVLPRGGQRGTEVQVTLSGNRLGDAQEILVYQPGITVGKIEQPEKGQAGRAIRARIKIAADARLGEYGLRVRTASGISEFRTFWVGPFPTMQASKTNSDFSKPQWIALNVTVEGVIESERVDYFAVDAKKGQRITAEIEGMRLGNAMFDPYVAILDQNRFELAASDDTILNKQDSIASVIAPKDGRYIIQVRDSAFGGSAQSHYRLHVGTFPRPLVVYPLGGQAGQKVTVQFLGDVKGSIARTISLPDRETLRKCEAHGGGPVLITRTPEYEAYLRDGGVLDLFCVEGGTPSPSPNHFKVSEFANAEEMGPSDTLKSATIYTGPPPVALNGILKPGSEGGDKAHAAARFWRFAAKKGQALDINVIARRLRSPLDSVLTLYDANGRQIAMNDDNGGPDSYLRFNVPADGNYVLRLRDHLRGAGPMHAYRIEITPVRPSIAITIPQYTQQYSQERQAVSVPRGNRYATLMRLTRQDAGGSMALAIPDLPPGVKIEAPEFGNGVDAIPVLFEAEAGAPVGGNLVEVTARPAPGEKSAPAELSGGFHQVVELVHGPPNQTPYYQTSVERMAIAVTQEAPFSLRIVQPKVPLVQGGQMNLKVIAERKKDFIGAIAVHFLFRPPGIDAASTVEIPGGKDEAEYPISASDGATVRKWKIVVAGSGDAGGAVWVASPFAELEVAPPMVGGKIAKAAVEQGQAVKIAAEIDVKTRWAGKAKVELLGLPGGTLAEPCEIGADQNKVEFNVKTQKSTPAATHNGIFLRVTIVKHGEPIVHNIARGGVLRVDLPPGARSEARAQAKGDQPIKKEKK